MLEWFGANLAKVSPEQVLNGLLASVVIVLGWIGAKAGHKPAPPQVAELAGAVIDHTSVKALIASQDNLAAALRENSEATRDTSKGLPVISTAVQRLVEATDETNDRLEKIKDELIRAPRQR